MLNLFSLLHGKKSYLHMASTDSLIRPDTKERFRHESDAADNYFFSDVGSELYEDVSDRCPAAIHLSNQEKNLPCCLFAICHMLSEEHVCSLN